MSVSNGAIRQVVGQAASVAACRSWRMQESRRFANPIADDGEYDVGAISSPTTFEADGDRLRRTGSNDDPDVEVHTPSPASQVRLGTSEIKVRVVPESLAHLSEETKEALGTRANPTRVLCDGKVNVQFRGKGDFVPCWVILDNKGNMTCRDASGACESVDAAGDEVRTVSVVGCVVRTPKTPRKNYHPAIRVDFAHKDSLGGRKIIMHVSPADARRSGLTLDSLKEYITAVSKQNDSAAYRRGQAVEQLIQKSTVMNPESTIRKRYDMLMLVMLTYIAVVVPFRIGFNVNVEVWTLGFFFELAVDAFFVADIVISFRSAYYDERGELEVGAEKIAMNYASGWFAIDAASCFPGNYIALALKSDEPGVVHMLGATRMLKLLRLARFARLMKKYEVEFSVFMQRIKAGKLLIYMLMLGHWLCCMWFAFGSLSSEALDQDGQEVLGWVARTWGRDDSLSTATVMDYYQKSFYWAIMTMTTVGYGDVVPQTGWETMVAIIGMILGGFVFGLIVSNLGELSKQQNISEVMRNEQLDLVRSPKLTVAFSQSSLHINGVPCCWIQVGAMLRDQPAKLVSPALTRQIMEHYDYAYTRRTVMDYRSLVLELPPVLRDQLAQEMRWVDGDGKGILYSVPFFFGVGNLSCIEICARMRAVLAQPLVEEADGSRSNVIMQEGEKAEEMCKRSVNRVAASCSPAESDGEERQRDRQRARARVCV